MTRRAPDQPRRRDRAGFLLTETLATFTISAFVLLGLVSASSVLLRAVDRSVAQVQDVDDLGRTVAAISRDVSSLTRARWNGYEPRPFVFRGGPNSLLFAHTQRGSDGAGETSVISLREIVAGNGTRLMRGDARLSAYAAGFGDLRFGPQRELGTGMARIRFYYVAPPGAKTVARRLREWPSDAVLPAAIIVEAVERETGRLILSTRVSIRANADIGCIATDGGKASLETTTRTTSTPPAAGGFGAPSTQDKDKFCGRLDQDKDQDKADPRNAALPQGGQPAPATGSPL